MTELTVIVPTLNERPNIRLIVDRLYTCLAGVAWEVIFVDDDSPDGTAEECRALACTDPKVRVLQRVGRRGLSSACLEGMLASASPYIAVMDGDLQHDESILLLMLEAAKRQQADVVVGSRNVEGGGMGEFSRPRVMLSNLGRRLSSVICKHELSDPMSGFFLIRRNYLEEVVHDLSGVGFKILLDLLTSSKRPVNIVEVPYVFRKRLLGESKLDIIVGFEFLVLLLDKLLGYTVPISFVLFALIGSIGVLIHLAVLMVLYRMDAMSFVRAQTIAIAAAMVCNFVFNNLVTHRSNRLRGWRQMIQGFAAFVVACSLGALANVATASFLVERHVHWIAAALAGITVGSVWNYSVTAVFTWHIGQRRIRKLPASSLATRVQAVPSQTR